MPQWTPIQLNEDIQLVLPPHENLIDEDRFFLVGDWILPKFDVSSKGGTDKRFFLEMLSFLSPENDLDAWDDFLSSKYETSSRPANLSCILEIYDAGFESCPTSLLAKFIGELKTLMRSEEYSVLDQVLIHLDFARLAPEVIVGLLRVTAPVRPKLRNWHDALDRAAKELNRRGFAPKKVLAGLA